MTRACHEIEMLIEDISEFAYAASWMPHAEYHVWRLLVYGGTWGMTNSYHVRSELADLAAHAERTGTWAEWTGGDDYAVSAIPLAKWEAKFEEWFEERKQRRRLALLTAAECAEKGHVEGELFCRRCRTHLGETT